MDEIKHFTLSVCLTFCIIKTKLTHQVIYCVFQYPYPSDDKSALTQDIHDLMEKSSHIVRDAYDSFNFYQGIVQIMTLLRLVNQFVQEQQPWKLKNDEDKEKLKWILSTSFEVLR